MTSNDVIFYCPPIQKEILVSKDIPHNYLNVQMVVDYCKESKQEIVMTQLEIVKTHNNASWLSIAQLMSHMGFDAMM